MKKQFLELPYCCFHCLRLIVVMITKHQLQKESLEKTINERIWLIIIDIVVELAIIFEADTEIIMEKIIADNQVIKKYLNLQPYINAT